ncbi:MAG: hypothetical protein AABX02_02005 [archaeon]
MATMNSMYHIGKVLEVLAPSDKTIGHDKSVQAQLEMWDDNVIIFGVDPLLTSVIQKGQYILVEYGFHAPQVPVNTVIKILDSKQGETIWKKQKQFMEKRKQQAQGMGDGDSDASPEHGMVR